MNRLVAIWIVVVLAAGVVVAITHDGGAEDVDVTGPPPTTVPASTVPGAPVPPAAPDPLPEGERVGGAAPTTLATTSTTGVPASAAPDVDPVTGADAGSWPELPGDGARVVVTPTGVVAAVQRVNDDGTYVVVSPCNKSVTVTGSAVSGAHVVLDPGHGGSEPGAVGPAGVREKDVNLAVTAEAVRRLESSGARVVVTRTADYRMTLPARAAIVNALDPLAFVSIHHNSDPDGQSDGPGSETYFQVESVESRRLAGLLVEEYRVAFGELDIDWVADTDAGAKYRTDSEGNDYYGVLRRTSGVASVLSEAAFISNPPEERLLSDPGFRRVEAEAIGRAIERFVFTDEPGSGYTEPYQRDESSGGGGGEAGCVDPPMS